MYSDLCTLSHLLYTTRCCHVFLLMSPNSHDFPVMSLYYIHASMSYTRQQRESELKITLIVQAVTSNTCTIKRNLQLFFLAVLFLHLVFSKLFPEVISEVQV